MENQNIQNSSSSPNKYVKEIPSKPQSLEKEDIWSDSKSAKHSRSGSNSPNYNINRKSSEISGFEPGQREEQNQSSQNFSKNYQNLEKPKLDFLIFISTKIKDSLLDNKILDSIISQIGGIQMDFDLNIKIPEYNGCLLRIKSNEILKKRDATQHLLEFIVKNNLDHPSDRKKKGEKIAIIIMIPNGLVSMIIGTKGKQISTLIEQSQASIVINQPIYKMTYRTVTISGYPEGIANGVMLIQKIMEERYNEVNNIEFESPPLNVMTTQTNVKIVLPEFIVDNICSKRHGTPFIEIIKNKFDVSTKLGKEHKNRLLDKNDIVCSFKGTINNVQDAILDLIQKIKYDIRSTYDGKESFQLKILINKVFVTKLIGAGGCMIQEIANFAKGASIKIMSSKNDDKKNNFHDIPLCIAGGLYSVQDATCIIIEQMECFKNGGPVLKSGKSLHENIAVQFMNSIFTNALPGENEDEHIYTLKEYFNPNNEGNEVNERNERNEANERHHMIESRDMNPNNKYKDYNNNKDYQESKAIIDYNNDNYGRNRSRSKSSSRSRIRERSRDRERDHNRNRSDRYDEQSSSKRYSRSNSRDYRRTHERERERERERNERNSDYRKRYEKPKNTGRGYQKPYSKFCCIENGINKISTQFTVPEHLVSLLIGKNGENVKSIMHTTGANVTFCKEYNDDGKINTVNGVARLCNLKGTIKQNMEAMGKILELVMKYEIGDNHQKVDKDKADENM